MVTEWGKILEPQGVAMVLVYPGKRETTQIRLVKLTTRSGCIKTEIFDRVKRTTVLLEVNFQPITALESAEGIINVARHVELPLQGRIYHYNEFSLSY